jgi:hypothetical protein
MLMTTLRDGFSIYIFMQEGFIVQEGLPPSSLSKIVMIPPLEFFGNDPKIQKLGCCEEL